MGDLLARLVELETAVSYSTPPPPGRRSFTHDPGVLPVLLSAPHGAKHRRDDYYKEEDEYTTALVRYVAAQTGAFALYTTHRSESDPNWDRHSPYKRKLQALVQRHDVQFVLDLHGMSNRHRYGVAVGTMNGRSCPNYEPLIVRTLTDQGFSQTTPRAARRFSRLRWDHFIVNHPKFTGGVTSHTVTRFVTEHTMAAAVQLELCASLRVAVRHPDSKWPQSFRGDPVGIETAVGALIALVRELGSIDS